MALGIVLSPTYFQK